MAAAGISVIIPAFNAAATIRATLDSVAGQSSPPLDVVVVDDGSTDGTAAIAEQYAGRLPHLSVIRVANGGVSRARNVGIAASRGDLIAPIDSDDVWHPRFLEELGGLHRGKPELGLVYSFLSRIDEQGRFLRWHSGYEAQGWAFYRLLMVNFICCGSNTVFTRRHFEAAGGYDETLPRGEDTLLQWELAARAPLGCVPKCLVGYRDRPGSLSKARREQSEHQLIITRKLVDRMPAIDHAKARTAFAFAHRQMATELADSRTGSYFEIAWHWLRAFLLDPAYARQALVYESTVNKHDTRVRFFLHWLVGYLLDPAYARKAWTAEQDRRDWLAGEAERAKQRGEVSPPEQPLFLDLPPDPPNVARLPDYALRLLEKAGELDERLGGPVAGR